MAIHASMSAVRAKVQSILATADLETLTERKVRNLLIDNFGDAAQSAETKTMIAVRVYHSIPWLLPEWECVFYHRESNRFQCIAHINFLLCNIANFRRKSRSFCKVRRQRRSF
jgi:hypothetical protein